MAKQGYLATLTVLIEADDEGTACDTVSELLRGVEGIVDWGYVDVGGRQLSPAPVEIADTYEEGDLFAMRVQPGEKVGSE